jgi:hypothetical protein
MTAKLTADLFKKRFTLFKDIEKREIDLPFCPECHLDLLQATASCSLCGTAMRTRMRAHFCGGLPLMGPLSSRPPKPSVPPGSPLHSRKVPAVANGVEMPVGNEDGTTTGVLSASAASEG